MPAVIPATSTAKPPADEIEPLIAQLYPQLLSFARTMVPYDLADDVVQETCIGVLCGSDTFEGRSSMKTWVYAILRNKARAALGAAARLREFEAEPVDGTDVDVLAGRLHPPGHPMAGHWSLPPSARFLPEEHAVGNELREKVFQGMARLPRQQRQVVFLRDVEGMTATEVCELLELDDSNQRTLLHRARQKLRAHIECYQFGRGCPDDGSGSWL